MQLLTNPIWDEQKQEQTIILQLSAPDALMAGEEQEIALLKLRLKEASLERRPVSFMAESDQTHGVSNDFSDVDFENFHFQDGFIEVSTTTDLQRSEQLAAPKTNALRQNYPNPFTAATTIRYQLSKPGEVKLMIYNLNGQLVRQLASENKDAGYFSIFWDGRDDNGKALPTGFYLCRMQTNDFSTIRRILLIK